MNKLPFLSADSVAAPPPQPPSWVLITGGAARLGKALCLAFADAGWNVVLHYRHSHAAAQQVQAQTQMDQHAHEAVDVGARGGRACGRG